MVIARKIAYNVLVSSLSKFLSTAIALVVIGFVTRYLGKEGFGDYATVLAFLAFFSAISDLGLYQFSTREISRKGADVEKIMANVFSLRLVSSLGVLFLSSVLAFFLPYSYEVRIGLVVVSASLVFSSGYQVLNGIFQKNLSMDRVVLSELVGKVLQLGVVVLAVWRDAGFFWIISSLFFNMLFSFCAVYFWSRKYLKLRLGFDFDYWKQFLRESYSIGVMAVIVFFYFKLDTLLISYLRGSSDVGIYNLAYKVLENITFFPAMIIGLVFPIMAQNIFADREKFRDVSNKTLKVFALLTVPLVVGVVFLADGVVGIIGGTDFSQSAMVLRILVFALAAIFFGNFFNAALIAANLQKTLMLILLFAAIFNLGMNLVFIPLFSYLAAATISVATEVFVAVATGVFVFKKLGYCPRVEKLPQIGISGFLMGLFLFFAHEWSFWGAGLGSVLVYAFAIWFFRAVETREVLSIISRKGFLEKNETISQG